MANDKEKELKKEIEELKELLKETMYAMCSYRTEKGFCAQCNSSHYCSAKKVIPKVEKILKIKEKEK